MTQGELFPVPSGRVRVPKARKATGTRAKYARIRPRKRTLCDDCVRDIHVRGVAVAPLPQPVRWRRVTTDGEITLLCEAHRRAHMETE
jgi:hypothetical protein